MESIVADVKEILLDAQTRLLEKPLIVQEPPHFYCRHDADGICDRAKMKRTPEEAEKYAQACEEYAAELRNEVNSYKAKRLKIAKVIKDIESLDEKKEPAKPEAPKPTAVTAPAAPVAKK